MDAVARRYLDIAYGAMSHPFTHPLELAATAEIFACTPKDPYSSKVLELGCNDGANLVAIAKDLPDAQCVGIDIIDRQINLARQRACDQNCTNIRFETADLRTVNFDSQQFDYIIVHGMLSWVPLEVQERIFSICRDHLAPNGIAFISFNALPGCATRLAFNELFALEQKNEETLNETSIRATINQVLKFFEATQDEMLGNHQSLIRETVTHFRQKNPSTLVHDQSGGHSEAFYLLQVASWAAEYDLSYVADSDLALNWLDVQPLSFKKAILEAKMPRLKALQYLDYFHNIAFHRSLFTKSADYKNPPCRPDYSIVQKLWLTRGERFGNGSGSGICSKLPTNLLTTEGTIAVATIIEHSEGEPTQIIEEILRAVAEKRLALRVGK